MISLDLPGLWTGFLFLGLTPMLFGLGGPELERPLAVVMVGGLVTSTLFTLLVLPAVFAHFGAAKRRLPASMGVEAAG